MTFTLPVSCLNLNASWLARAGGPEARTEHELKVLLTGTVFMTSADGGDAESLLLCNTATSPHWQQAD